MKRMVVLASVLFIGSVGCTSYVKPDIVPTGQNSYLLSRASKAMGWGNLGEMKAEVYREANAFAESKGKVIVQLLTNEAPVACLHCISLSLIVPFNL